jgi:lipid-A-disaccharide synthase
MRLFVSTGEVSGDLQASLLVESMLREAQRRGLDLEVVALGGDRLEAAGAKLLANTAGIGAIGLVEALPYVRATQQIQAKAKAFLRDHPPDMVVLVDYMGANIPLGNYLRKTYPQMPIYYYIAPQEWVWAFGEGNTRQILGFVDEILAIFPGEAKYYEDKGAKVRWVGHPLLDRVQSWPSRAQSREQLGIGADELAIALFPASRTQEIKYLMPLMLEAARRIQDQVPQVRFWIPCAMERYREPITAAVEQYGLRATLVEDSRAVIGAVDLAIAKSGTVSLELALMDVPQVVVYRVSAVTAWIMRNVIKMSLPFVSPANLVNREMVVTELLQEDVTPEKISAAALMLLQPEPRNEMLAGYARMRKALGEPGACDRAAEFLLSAEAKVRKKTAAA